MKDKDAVEFWSWIKIGEDRGWISRGVCMTHDGVPMSKSEEDEMENGGDPCVPVFRAWL